MSAIDAQSLTDEALLSYDDMMIECLTKIEHFSPLATSIWAEVLRELDLRKLVELVSGSYEDIGNARIKRLPRAKP